METTRSEQMVKFMQAVEGSIDDDGNVICQRCERVADPACEFEGMAVCEPCAAILSKGELS